MHEPMHQPIEDYLDDLLLQLRLPPRECRRLLAETEAHLREAADAAERGGMTREAAELAAIRRYGTATEVARAASAARRSSPLELFRNALWAGVMLAGAALTAVGLSGLLAALANAVVGPRFVGALPEAYEPAACRHFLAAHSTATTCSQAAMLENSQDAVVLRLLAGVLGVALLVAALVWRRHLRRDHSGAALLDGAVSACAAVAFAGAAAVCGGLAVHIAQQQHGSGGVGFYLSGSVASAVAGLVAAVVAYRRLRLVRPWRFGAGPLTA